jgi:hypothetical protein
MKKKRADHWVEKERALRTLAAIGKPCTAEDFGRALVKQRFRMNGDHRCYNILDRLRRQGLVARSAELLEVEYPLKLRNGQTRMVRRPQRKVRWAITPRGNDRIRRLEAMRAAAGA